MITADYANLATEQDVEKVLQRDLTTPEQAALPGAVAKASRLFRRESGQIFTPGTSAVRLRVAPGSKAINQANLTGRRSELMKMGTVYLRQRPVNEVTSVTDDYGDTVTYEQFDQWLFIEGLSASDFVRVAYSHGSETVPADVVQVISEMVARSLPVSEDVRTGLTADTETTGPFSTQRQYAAWAVGGSITLSPDERAFAQSFRQRIPILWVNRP